MDLAPSQTEASARTPRPATAATGSLAWIAAALALSLGCALFLVFHRQINWDEFRYLADVYRFRNGSLAEPLLTFHVHAFGWLAGLFRSEVDQVVAARLVMFALHLGTCASIYLASRRIASPSGAIFAVLVFASFSFVLSHGAAFRFDPPATFFLMTAVAIIMAAPLRVRFAVLAGLALAVAALITIKSALYAPVILAAVAWRVLHEHSARRAIIWFASLAVVAAVAFAALYAAHAATMPAGDLRSVSAIAASSAAKVTGTGQAFPRSDVLIVALTENPLAWLAIAVGFGAALLRARRSVGRERLSWLALAACASTLATLAFYRNAYPYYYVFMLPPAAILAALAADDLLRPRQLLAPVAGLMGMLAVVQTAQDAALDQGPQRVILGTIHDLFPEPTPYIDRASMVSSYPKAGFFMSSWGVEAYRDRNQAIFRDILIEEEPSFLLANSPVLAGVLSETNPSRIGHHGLLAEDAAVLRDNFLHHWGEIWVPGRTLDFAETPDLLFETLVPGPYTVEASQPVRIDGALYADGEVAQLARGRHDATAALRDVVTLRRGDNLPVPPEAPPEHPSFRSF